MTQQMKKPHILIFNPDHYRGEALHHAGNPAAVTPHLDALVEKDGVSFTNAFCQNGVCSPSRCSFMSGWYTHVRGHRTMHHLMHKDEPVLLRTLKNNGYHVFWAGKNDLVPAQEGFEDCCDEKFYPTKPIKKFDEMALEWRGGIGSDRMFSFYHGKLEKEPGEEIYYDGDWAMVLGAIDRIKNAPKDKPLCIYLPLKYPHPPFAVEDPYYSMIDEAKLPPRIPAPKDWSGKSSMLHGVFKNHNLGGWSEDRWDELRKTHLGMCARLDHQFGLIVQALKEAGMYDDTALFFFSDHGMYAGDFSVVDINQNTFEDPQVRVPFIIKPPKGHKVKCGTRDALVELVDFTATVFDITGIAPDYTSFGKSLMPLVSGEKSEHRDAVFAEGGRLSEENHCKELEYKPGHTDPTNLYYPRLILQASDGPEHTKAIMCRTKEYKFVYRLYEKHELYDLKKDPWEHFNVIDNPDYSTILAALEKRMLKFFVETGDVVPFKPDVREARNPHL